MILRRVIDHFRKQEWTAIALDFLIVVVGVFVGIQVSNLNEAGKAARHEAQILEQLQSEFAAFSAVTTERMETQGASLEATREVLNVIRGGVEPTDKEAFNHVLWLAGRLEAAAPEPTTLLELIASGRLSELSSPALRSLLVRFHQAMEEHQQINELALQRISETEGGRQAAVFVDPDNVSTVYGYDWEKVRDMRGQSQVLLIGKRMALQ